MAKYYLPIQKRIYPTSYKITNIVAVYLEEGFEYGRVGVGEEDDGEERADAAVEHRGPDVGHRVLGPLVAVSCKGRKGQRLQWVFPKESYGGLCVFGRGKLKRGPNRALANR